MAQGALGDAWLVSALNTLRLFPGSLKKIIVSDRHSDKGTLCVDWVSSIQSRKRQGQIGGDRN